HRLDGGLDLVDGRDHDHFDEAVVLFDNAEDLKAADSRQPHVEENQIHVVAYEDAERCFTALRAQHPVLALQNRCEGVAHPLVVVDDEDGLWFLHSVLPAALRPSQPRGRAALRGRGGVLRATKFRWAPYCRRQVDTVATRPIRYGVCRCCSGWRPERLSS